MVSPTTNRPVYEAATQSIGRELLAATRSPTSFVAHLQEQLRWDDRLLGWMMGNPNLRVQLFRLIDCLPSLTEPADIARHLQEYLVTPAVELPPALKALLEFPQPNSIPGRLAATTFTTAVSALARKYIAGDTIEQTLQTIARLRKSKLGFTLDLLGEAVVSETEAQQYLERYLKTMAALSGATASWAEVPNVDRADGQPLARVQVSVKLTAFYSQFDPLDVEGSRNGVGDRIRTLLRRARELGVAVHFDMEQYAYKSLTIPILQELLMEGEFRDRDDIGVTLQAYLRDSKADLQSWIAWAKRRGTPITVRLVKGAYWDAETIHAIQNHWPQPVFNSKELTDANFEWLTQELLEHHEYLYAAIGSHNVRSQAKAIAIARQLQIPSRRIELQVLYGMANTLATALVEQGMRVRVYAPSGELIPGMSYLIRRLLENTANTSFLKQRVGKVADDVLLAEPDENQTEPPLAEYEPQFERAPLTNFSQVEDRDRALEAIQAVRQQLGQTYRPLIDGEWIDTDRQIESLNPSKPSEVIGRVQLCGTPELERAIAAAKAALPNWRATAVKERSALLQRIADRIQARQAELAAWIVLEVGKPLKQADADVVEAIDFCRYYAFEMERLEAGERYDLPGEANRYRYRSRGITAVISPWNFPLAIPTGMTVASLVTGNCTILKPSQQSCVIAAKFAEIVEAAGVPSGVFQFVPGSGSDVGRSLVRSPNVHTIVFTGSQHVGCEIYAEAAVLQPGQHHLKRTIAEMGGKNAVIVDASADLDKAVQGIVQSAFGYSGQKCSACSRVIVLPSVYDEFLRRLVDATRSLSVGPADLPSTVVGPVIDEISQPRIREAIVSAKATATLALELAAPDEGYFVEPTIFTDVVPDSDLAQQEIFGPVLAVLRAATFDEAIAIANSTSYALTGGLYSRTPSHIEQAQQDFEVGNLYVNRGITGAIVRRQPFGGFKLSGVGSKAGGSDYLLQFLEPRTVTENVQRQGFAPIERA